jgi:hypothetical protein
MAAAALSLTQALAYDGDVDFSAPYMTLDPETGKLITVDPKQQPGYQQNQQAAGQQHTPAAASSSTPAQQPAETQTTAAGTAGHDAESQEAASPIPIITVVAGVIAVSVVVVMGLRKTKGGPS